MASGSDTPSIPPKPPSPSLSQRILSSPHKAKQALTAAFTGKKQGLKSSIEVRHKPYARPNATGSGRNQPDALSLTDLAEAAMSASTAPQQLDPQTAHEIDMQSAHTSNTDGSEYGEPTIRIDRHAAPRELDMDTDEGECSLHEDIDTTKKRLQQAVIQAANCLAMIYRSTEDEDIAAYLDPETTANIQYLATAVCILPETSALAIQSTLDSQLGALVTIIKELRKDVDDVKNDTQRSIEAFRATTSKQLEKLQTDTAAKLERIEKIQQTTVAPAPASGDARAVFASGPTFKPASPPSNQHIPHNQTKAHHPSRLIIGINDLPPTAPLPDADKLATDINAALKQNDASKHLLVINVKWNKRRNCILTVRDGQTGAELAKHAPLFSHLIAPTPDAITVREDKKWFKIQVNGVRTGTQDALNRNPYTPETLHAELCAKNPVYAKTSIIQAPRFTRSPQELMQQHYSSIVFATDDEAAYRRILFEHKTLSMFNRWCKLTAFADRPPVKQCKECWSLKHDTAHCPDHKARCRLCGSLDHDEARHAANCAACLPTGDMDVDRAPCAHDLNCINCENDGRKDNNHACDSRRCPARLEIYGTARDRERQKQPKNTTAPGAAPKRTIRKKPAKTTNTGSAQPGNTVSSQNRFAALREPSIDNLQRLLQSAGATNITREQAAAALKGMTAIYHSSTSVNDWGVDVADPSNDNQW